MSEAGPSTSWSVTLRAWLRRARTAGTRAGRRLLGGLLGGSSAEEFPPGEAFATNALAERGGRVVRLVSRDVVRLDAPYRDLSTPATEDQPAPRADETYAEWLAPLARLPHDATADDVRRAVESLAGFREDAPPLHFPLEDYLRALSAEADNLVGRTHLCRATRRPSLNFLLARAGRQPDGPMPEAATSVVLLRASHAADAGE
ncbi:MAG TPA: hypothetical protein VER08_11935 [Pyrinomonadaceae bacterium]|nr:hypothetical protein [Pyrinomonadaceae bacterium]